jgi:predicted double-glycine peptidase
MASTIATVLADQDGSKMFDEKGQKEILDMAPETMREIYEASLNYGFALGDNEEKK